MLSVIYYITQEGVIKEGSCPSQPGHSGGSNEIANNTPIQDVTKAQCNELPIFTGANNEAIRNVTDNRGGITRTYRIAKLADNNCWMLDNLRVGSESQAVELTS